ncbi:uncharacterized protein B0P05DRAFT_556805 [Gilbertella persicaria]|uniref:uncharacterized protein n=1 Tax=Gilbertella persicaria TaxID=101096 RepID=UPI002220CC5F|nr:uncharacterized protein B0P05DRAFT_556805 [Gilbertella persicaria]KAI8061828.1 hypothetical protein B0P05DRAFT_556805 [Gilbertella persicaria]
MSSLNSLHLSTQNIKQNDLNCLEQYYRYLVGMPTKDTTLHAILQQPDLTQYQKIYVDTLVDITTLTIRTSWPMEVSTTKEGQPVVNTNVFIRHLLKRSRATRSTLQLAIFYLFRIRPHIAKRSQFDPIVKCGRRMFLASLICAHKYLYDNTFTNASWAKISKLPVKEINGAEKALLEMLDYRLHVSHELYQKFESQLREAVPNTPVPMPKKRALEQYHPIVVKKQKHTSYTTVHGIPTPEDDKVEIF